MARFGASARFLTRLLGTCVGPVYDAISWKYRFLSVSAMASYFKRSSGANAFHLFAIARIRSVTLTSFSSSCFTLSIISITKHMYADLNRFGASGACKRNNARVNGE